MIHLGVEGHLSLVLYAAMWAAFLASVFWRPSVGVYLLVLSLPFQTGRYRIHDLPLGSNFLDILLLGTFLGLWRKGEEIFPKSPINKLLVILVVYYYLSLWEGSFFLDIPLPLWISDPRFSEWKNYVEMFLFAPLVAAALKEKRQIKWLVIFMNISMLLVNRSFYSVMRDRDLSHFSYDVRDAAAVGYAGINGLAALEVMFSSFLMAMFSGVKALGLKAAILFVLATCIYCTLFAFSRGGYIAMLAALMVLGLLKHRMLLVLLAALFISWQTLLPTSVQERILMTESQNGALDHSSQGRVLLWADALSLFGESPLTGTGFNTYEYMNRYESFHDTHNYYLKIMVETGTVGFVLFIALLFRMAQMGYKLFRTSDDPFWSGVGLGFFVLVCSAIVLNFFGDRWTYQQINGYMWVLLGCVIRGQLTVDAKEKSITISFPLGQSKVEGMGVIAKTEL
jgi:putative inorganic carbon (hco3(-)) transporter